MAAVMIGIDPHKASHTAVAISAAEEELGELRVRACAGQAEQLLGWAAAWPQRTWAVEGAGGMGYLLAQQLVAAGERVLDVQLTALLAGLSLEPKAAKTRIVHLEEGGEGFDFLGFHHRLVRSRGQNGKKPVTFLARWPSDRAMQHARDRIRELTGRRRLLLWPELIAEDLNGFLRGWAAYFRYGHSAERLSTIRQYAQMRLAPFISKKHRRSRNFGWRIMLVSSPGDLGLVSLYGITVAPRAGKPWREKPNAGGERRR